MNEFAPKISRRDVLRSSILGTSVLGTAALGTLLNPKGARAIPHFTPTAKRVVYLFMCGGPSQFETFDWKPEVRRLEGTELPDSVRRGERLTGMTSSQGSFLLQGSRHEFAQHGESGAWVSDVLPHTASVVDRLCIIRSMHTDAINHDPALTLMHTGDMLVGRPCFGSWVSYGLGSQSSDLPTFVVLPSVSQTQRPPQPLPTSIWSPGFLPAEHQGVPLRGGDQPVLYLDDRLSAPSTRDRLRSTRAELDALHRAETGNTDIDARIASYELAFSMQTAVPDALSNREPESTYSLYGDDARTPGTFAANCVLARKLLEADVPFVQLYHRDWDQHAGMMSDLPIVARDTDRAASALLQDLEQRGLLDDTLVVWGGEFGRTVYAQGEVTTADYGRDHHRRCFSMWLAGAGIRAGTQYGQTDDFSYNIASDPVHVHDLHATLLHLLGFDHTRLTYRYAGRDFRLTDVAGRVIEEWLR